MGCEHCGHQANQPPPPLFICTACEARVPVAFTVVHENKLTLVICYGCFALGVKYIVRHALAEERFLNRGGEPGAGLP